MTSKTNFSRFMQSIDIFGLKTEFQIDQKSKFKTISGGVFTLIYIGLIILLFFSFGNDMINHLNPETTFSQIYQLSPSPTTVSKDDYMFVFGMQDKNGDHFIDEEIYTATVTYRYKNQTTKKSQSKSIPLQRCEEANLPRNNMLSFYFKNQANELSDLYCISKNYTDPLILQGAWDQTQYNYLRLSIAPCNSSQRTCKTTEEIINKLQTSYYAYYSTDNLFDMRNYENPANLIGRDYYTQTTYNVKKILNRYLRTNHFYDESGWIMDSTYENNYFSFDYDHESFELLTQTDKIVDMVIRKSSYESIFTRKYKKIQNVFAEMAGFLQIIFTVLLIISGPFVKKEYYESITNSIYNFEVEPDGKPKQKDKNGKERPSMIHKEKLRTFRNIMKDDERKNDTHSNSPPQMGSSDSKKKKKSDEDLVNYLFKLKESPLKLSYLEIAKGLLVRDPELEVKKTQRKIGISSIFSQLDIKYILNKFVEIDKLKMLLLNQDQYQLFEYLPKPVIMKNAKINLNSIERFENKSPLKFLVHQDDLVLKAKTVQKAFDNIIKKTEMNEIDKKLIQTLDADILKVLKSNTANFTKIITSKTSNFGNMFGLFNFKRSGEIENIDNNIEERESELSERKGDIIVSERNNELFHTFASTDSKNKFTI